MQVAAGTGHKETVLITQPNTGHLLLTPLTLFTRTAGQVQRLIFESRGRDFAIRVIGQVEEQQMIDGRLLLTRHLILVCFQGRTWHGHRIDHPQLLDCPIVGTDDGKTTRVGRPSQVTWVTTFAVAECIRIEQAIRLPKAIVLHAITGQLHLDNRTILFVTFGFLIVRITHAVEVHIFGKDNRLFVWRDRGPLQLFV